MDDRLKVQAKAWIDAWNRRDLPAIMAHYSECIVFSSPTVTRRWGAATGGILRGKQRLRDHFAQGLTAYPLLRFELLDVLSGVEGITILYRRETGARVADVLVLDSDGRALSATAYYSAKPEA